MSQEVAAFRRAARAQRAAPRCLCLLLGLTLAAASPVAALPGGGGVRIDGALVPAAEVWAEYSYLTRMREIIHPKPAGAIDAGVFGTVVEQVLNRNLLAREAVRRGLVLSAEERAAIRARQVAGWKGEANFQTALAMLGISEAHLLHRMEMNELVRKMTEHDVDARGAATEADLRTFHRENPGKYFDTSPALRYLLLPEPWKRKQQREFAGEAQRLRDEGKDYDSLVKRFSTHESAARGGLVGEGGAAAGGWPHPQLSADLKPGRFSREAQDEAGVHLYVRDIQQVLPFEEVSGRVRTDHREQRIAERLRSITEALRRQAKVELLEGAPPQEGAAPPAGHR